MQEFRKIFEGEPKSSTATPAESAAYICRLLTAHLERIETVCPEWMYIDYVQEVRRSGTIKEMTVSITDFRKNLFQLVERALNGEMIEIVHKNRTIRLAPTEPKSKLSRLVQRDTLNCTWQEFDQAVRAQDEEVRSQWEQKWQSRL